MRKNIDNIADQLLDEGWKRRDYTTGSIKKLMAGEVLSTVQS
jgi:hypothetical protein